VIGNVLAGQGQIGGVLATGRRPGGAGFVGAYDAIPSIVAAYGMRRLRGAYTGSILRLRRSSDNAEQDIGYVANGDLDTAAVATFVGAGSGYIQSWYDQSGNAYTAAQTTAANQPLYVASGQNGRPVGRFDNTNDLLATVGFGPLAQPITVVVVWKSNNTVISKTIDGIDATNRVVIESGAFANVVDMWAGQYVQYPKILPMTTPILTTAMFNGASSQLFENGTTKVSGNAGSQSLGGITLGMRFNSTNPLNGDIAELIICNAALSAADRQAAEAAANTYWAIY